MPIFASRASYRSSMSCACFTGMGYMEMDEPHMFSWLELQER